MEDGASDDQHFNYHNSSNVKTFNSNSNLKSKNIIIVDELKNEMGNKINNMLKK